MRAGGEGGKAVDGGQEGEEEKGKGGESRPTVIFTAQCTLVHMRGLGIACCPSVRPSVRPSVCPSVCNVGGL